MMSKLSELKARYAAAMHAVQSGVAVMMNFDGGTERGETSPKHLRTGVNSALVDSGALAGLLMRKGVITEEEYLEALAEAAEREKLAYEQRLNEGFGPGVVLR